MRMMIKFRCILNCTPGRTRKKGGHTREEENGFDKENTTKENKEPIT